MTTKKFFMCLLVFILGSSFNEIDYYKKHLLIEGKIITEGRWVPNGYLQFYTSNYKGKIRSITLKGSILFFTTKKEINIKDIKKDSLTTISLGESLDKIFTLKIDPLFNEEGGIIYSSITDNKSHTDYYVVDIVKENNLFKTYRTKIEKPDSLILQRKKFDEIKIELDVKKNIKFYEFFPQ